MKIMKFLLLLLFTFSTYSWAQGIYLFKKMPGCYMKKQVNGALTDISMDEFLNRTITAKAHPKNDKFMVIRENNEVFVTKRECLESKDDTSGLVIQDNDEEERKPKKIKKQKKVQRPKNWMIDIEGGLTFFPGSGATISDFTEFDGTLNGQTYAFDEESKPSKYTGGSLVGLSFGRRVFESSFFTFKIKRYTGKKVENVNVTVDGNPQVLTINFQETFVSALFGIKIMFLPQSFIRPSIGLFFGGNAIASRSLFESASSGGSGEVDFGLEFFISESMAFGINSGVEFLGQREFKAKGPDGDIDYKSSLDYTNYFATVGLKFYL
jgi:hypothetical protein